MNSASRLPAAMPVAEFLAWTGPDGSERWELVEGEPRAMAPSSPRHGAIVAQVARLLGSYTTIPSVQEILVVHVAGRRACNYQPK
jgi:hypothetical protein